MYIYTVLYRIPYLIGTHIYMSIIVQQYSRVSSRSHIYTVVRCHTASKTYTVLYMIQVQQLCLSLASLLAGIRRTYLYTYDVSLLHYSHYFFSTSLSLSIHMDIFFSW